MSLPRIGDLIHDLADKSNTVQEFDRVSYFLL